MALPATILPQGNKRDAQCLLPGGGWLEQSWLQQAETTKYKACNAIIYPGLVDEIRIECYEISNRSQPSLIEVDFIVGLGQTTGGGWEAIGTYQPKSLEESVCLCTVIKGVPSKWVAIWARVSAGTADVFFSVAAKWGGTSYEVLYGSNVKPGP